MHELNKYIPPCPKRAIESLPGYNEVLKAMEAVKQHLTRHADAGRWLLPNDKTIRVKLKDRNRLQDDVDLVPFITFGGDWLRDAGFLSTHVRLIALHGLIVIVPDSVDHVMPLDMYH